MKELLDMFLTFARIGGFTFGGGYAMLPMLQKEVVNGRHWATDEELMDYYAIGQCTPGIIAVNTATFVGYKNRGIPGAIAATLGVIAPSLVIIMIIAAFISNFIELSFVSSAFAGIRACVCVLIGSAVVKLAKKSLVDKGAIAIAAVVFVLSLFTSVSPALLVVVPGVLDVVEELVMQGRDLTQLTADFTWYLRNLLLVKTSDNIEDVLDVSTENMMQLKEESGMIETAALFRYIRVFSELSGQLKYATQKRIMLEVALIKLCTPAMETKQDTILERIRAVEEKVEKSMEASANMQGQIVYVNGDGAQIAGGSVINGNTEGDFAGARAQRPQIPDAIPEDVQEVVKNFRMIAGEASGIIKGYLKSARLSLGGDNRLLIVLPDSLAASVVGREDHVEELEKLIEERIGKRVEVEVRHVEEGRHFEDTFIDIEQKINMKITVED